MTRRITLTVNNMPISLDYFVEGYLDHVVGGILASLLDEAMSNATYTEGIACLTANMQMRLRQPVMVATPLVVTARITKKNRKLIETEARICLEDGTVVAESSAKQFIAEDESPHGRRVREYRSHV